MPKTIEEIETRLNAIKAELDNDDADVEALNAEAMGLIDERKALKEEVQTRQNLREQIANNTTKEEVRKMPVLNELNNNNEVKDNSEVRAKKFVESGRTAVAAEETRAMLLSSGQLVTPTGVKENINELDGPATSILNMIDVENCEGMGSNTVAYEFTASEAGVTEEGEAYHEGDTVTKFVTMTPKKITTLSYISEEVRKLTPVKYEEKVRKNALNALRKEVAKQVVDKLKASTLCKALSLTAIDAGTMRKIALSYGGEETVNGAAVAFLNRDTLIALGDIRGTQDKKAVYTITPDTNNGDTGVITEGGLAVKYCIKAGVPANTIIYGQPTKFELDLFGQYEIKVSEDFKFDKGMLAIRGCVLADGDVTFKDGFIVAAVA